MPSRLTVGLALAMLLSAALALWGWSSAWEYKDTLTTRTHELEAEQARTQRLQKAVRDANISATSSRFQVKEVLDESPVWSDTAVPEPVRSGLCKHINCR